MRTALCCALLFSSWSSQAVAADAAPAAPAAVPAKDYELQIIRPETLEVAKAADIVITIKPKAPWLMKSDTPFQLTLKPSAGLQLEKTKLTAKDYVDAKSSAKAVKVPVTATVAGEQTLEGTLSFFLCTEVVCKRMTEALSFKLVAK
jgi:hypothetical protein